MQQHWVKDIFVRALRAWRIAAIVKLHLLNNLTYLLTYKVGWARSCILQFDEQKAWGRLVIIIIVITCYVVAGRSYAISSQRMLIASLESVAQKCQSGVVIHFEKIGPDIQSGQ